MMKIIIFGLVSLSLALQGNAQTPSYDFSEAIEDIDTVSPSLLKSQRSLEVTFGNSKLESLALHLPKKNNTEEDSGEELLINTSDFSKDCGRDDKCPADDSDGDSIDKGKYSFGVRSRKHLDYSQNPYTCRCDIDECINYGDCCWNITIGFPLPTTKNLWRCNHIHEQNKHAMMISECPSKSQSYLTELCAADPENISNRNYTYLVDIPVFSKVTQYLYRNIYCAHCHGERNAGILHWKTHLFCSEKMTQEKQEKFIQNSKYFPGQRYFQDNNKTCVIYISELMNTRQKLEEIIPTIRYCGGNSIETCPENSLMTRDARLCSMYTQHIYWRERQIFKNYHCARCNGHLFASIPGTNALANKTLLQRGQCYRDKAVQPKISSPAPPKGPQGISLLFDFALDSFDEALVGYDTLCGDDEIWDYLHKRCQMAVCQKGYFLQGEACHPIVPSGSDDNFQPSEDGEWSWEDHHGQNGTFGNSSHSASKHKDDPINSTCMRILLFESEYSFISKNNTSIIVHDPKRMDKPIIFHPDEYEYWNETTLAVCAKDLHEGFINRFSSLLNYLSTISVGISVIFSFLHMIIYLSLPKLHNLPGKTLFCLTVSLFVSQLIFLTLITHSRWHGLCVTASITMHYSFLAAFFWMNVMSFDVWRTFSGTILLSRTQTALRKNITFLKYSLFAWLTPLIIVALAVLVEFFPISTNTASSSMSNSFNSDAHNSSYFADLMDKIRPAYGQNGFCWFGQRLSLFVFFAFPVALVITSNIVLFSLSAKAILIQNQEAGKVFHTNESNKTCAKKISTVSRVNSKEISTGMEDMKVKLYAKLALIMGLTWIMGFISNFPKMEWLWFPFVVLNGLQGTFIFFAFDCKWKIVRMLRQRYGQCKWFSFKFGSNDNSSQGSRQRKKSASQGDSSANSSATLNNSTSHNRTLSTSVETM